MHILSLISKAIRGCLQIFIRLIVTTSLINVSVSNTKHEAVTAQGALTTQDNVEAQNGVPTQEEKITLPETLASIEITTDDISSDSYTSDQAIC